MDPETLGGDVRFDEVARIMERASRCMPALADARYQRGYSGAFDITPDWMPILDETDVRGLYVAAGMSGHGFKLSPAVGRMMADLITGAARPRRPPRPSGWTASGPCPRRRRRLLALLPALTAAPAGAGVSAARSRRAAGGRVDRDAQGQPSRCGSRSRRVAERLGWRVRVESSASAATHGRPGSARGTAILGRLGSLGGPRERWAAVVAAWTSVAFLPAVRNGFVDWDDVRMFLENPYHRGSWVMRMRGAWATHLLGEYMPVTWTSYALDRALWDLDAGGYHLTSLGLHVATTLAVYAVAWRLLGLARARRLDERGRALAAAVAALAFGVHPLRAEPVGG